MTDQQPTVGATTDVAPAPEPAAPQFSAEAGLEGAASFADAEAREILNLLGDAESGGSCCGGSCCSV